MPETSLSPWTLCEYGAVINLGENRLTLWTPVPPSEKPQTESAPVRVAADHVNLPPQSSVVVPVVTDSATCGKVVLEGDIQLLLGKGIGITGGITELQDGRTGLLMMNFRQETQHPTKDITVGHVEELRNSGEIAARTEEFSSPQQDSTSPEQLDVDPSFQIRNDGS